MTVLSVRILLSAFGLVLNAINYSISPEGTFRRGISLGWMIACAVVLAACLLEHAQ